MTLQDTLQVHGAQLAPDGIPLQFSHLGAEYDAALNSAVLMVRSHEGRLELTGRDRLALMHRMSTNHLEALAAGQGAATIFANANARILDRAVVVSRPDRALVLAEPGRGPALESYLRRNIFFIEEADAAEAQGHQQHRPVRAARPTGRRGCRAPAAGRARSRAVRQRRGRSRRRCHPVRAQ